MYGYGHKQIAGYGPLQSKQALYGQMMSPAYMPKPMGMMDVGTYRRGMMAPQLQLMQQYGGYMPHFEQMNDSAVTQQNYMPSFNAYGQLRRRR